MKKPKILIIMMLIVALVGCSPVWAEEGDAQNANSDIISGSDVGDDVSGSETGTDVGGTNNGDTGTGDPGESGEPGSGADAGNAVGTPTVNISEESIEAIAYAITRASYSYAYQTPIRTDDNFRFWLDTNIADIWDNYAIVVMNVGQGYSVYICENMNLQVDVSGNMINLSCSDTSYPIYVSRNLVTVDGSAVSFSELGEAFRARQSTGMMAGQIVFSNVHIREVSTGGIYYESAYAPLPGYIVSFETGVENITYPPQQINSWDDFQIPAVEGLNGEYTFEGWFFDAEYTQPFRPIGDITTDTVIYGKFVKVPLISFVVPLFDDMTFEPQRLNTLQMPTPEKEGYVFLGWFYDEAFLQEFSRNDEITEDTTIYGRFVEESYMAVFTSSVFDSLTSLFEVQAIRYILAIMALVIIFGAIKILTSFK